MPTCVSFSSQDSCGFGKCSFFFFEPYCLFPLAPFSGQSFSHTICPHTYAGGSDDQLGDRFRHSTWMSRLPSSSIHIRSRTSKGSCRRGESEAFVAILRYWVSPTKLKITVSSSGADIHGLGSGILGSFESSLLLRLFPFLWLSVWKLTLGHNGGWAPA